MVGTWFARHALLPDGLARDVRFEVEDGRFLAVTADARATGATELPGVVLPGFANAHSHAFHRALRGRTHADGGTFWTWRDRMYALAERLDPDRYLHLARATYAEMVLTGITCVGEFHYLHHGAGGERYPNPNAMGEALRQAARDAGLRITLLDACYLTGGLDDSGYRELDTAQRRFSDGDAQTWAARVGSRRPPGDTERLGVAVHSVRAVQPEAIGTVVACAGEQPLHVHVSEQPGENAACRAVHGMTPLELLAREGALGPRTTAVHATHLTPSDRQLLRATTTTLCMCPTTERDLADGIGPAHDCARDGVRLALGTDQHALLDFFEEGRGLEMDERLATGERGRFDHPAVVSAMTGHGCLGWDDAGALAVGRRADLVAVRLDSPRTAGCPPEQIVFAAGAPDVDTVVIDGQVVVQGGRHRLGDVGTMLVEAIGAAWQR